MKTLDRLRRRRRLTVSAVVLTVVATVAAMTGLAGLASALPTPTNGASPLIAITQSGPSTFLKSNTANQAVPDFNVSVNDFVGDPTHTTWTAGDHMSLLIGPTGTNGNASPFIFPNGPNNGVSGNWVGFSSVPTVTVTNPNSIGPPLGFAPTLTCVIKPFVGDSLATQGTPVNDLLECTFTNTSSGLSVTPYQVTFSNIKVSTGSETVPGPILAFGQYGAGNIGDTNPATTVGAAGRNYPFTGGSSTVGPGNLFGPYSTSPVIDATASGNNPAVSILPNAVGAPISPIVIQELDAGAIGAGFLCYELQNSGDSWSTASSALVTSVSNPLGGATAVSPVINIVNGAFPGADVVDVVITPSTFPSTITLQGMKVNTNGDIGAHFVKVYFSTTSFLAGVSCAANGTQVQIPGDQNFGSNVGNVTAFSVGSSTINTRIAGFNADGTAVAALEAAYPPQPGNGCLPNNTPPNPGKDDVGSSVVLTTDQTWQDALTASYLASYLHTGVLLTPTNSLNGDTANAIRNEGASAVYIVGGPMAVSTGVENTLKGTQQYQCGGSNPRNGDQGGNLSVSRIWGQTALDTAFQVSNYVAPGFVNNQAGFDLSGTGGATAGTSLYNRSGGGTDTSASLPTVPVRTAILTTSKTFQDATASSALAYTEQMPIFITDQNNLSPQAQTGLLNLSIRQVIVLGGPDAIGDGVISDLTNTGIGSVRIAGTEATDTSVQLATFEVNDNAGVNGHKAGLDWERFSGCPENQRLDCFTVAVARGDLFQDALTSSVVTGNSVVNHHGYEGPEPLVLTTDPNTLSSADIGFFKAAGSPYGVSGIGYPNPVANFVTGSSIFSITPFGGILALSDATLQGILNAISAGANGQ